MDAGDELVALAVGMGFAEAQARRCVSVLADTAEARALFLREPERLVNALLEFGQPSPRRGARGGGAAAGGGSDDVIDLCDSSADDDPPPPAKRARADAPPPVALALPAPADAPPARAEAPPPADSAAPGGGRSLMAQLAAERHARRGMPAAVEAGPPALEEVKLLTCAHAPALLACVTRLPSARVLLLTRGVPLRRQRVVHGGSCA